MDEAPWGHLKSRPVLYEDRAGSLRVWDWPQEGVRYVIGADVAEGRVKDLAAGRRRPGMDLMRERPDFSAAIVLELETGRHVATWHGDCEPSEWAACLVAIGFTWNTALLIPEVNGPGLAAVDVVVKVFRYQNLYRRKTWNRDVNDHLTTEFGWATSRTTRPMLIQRIHEWLGGNGQTRDAELVKELRTMEFDEQGVARARHRNKDDRVLALGMALQGRYELLYGRIADGAKPETSRTDGYTGRVWQKVRNHMERMKRAKRMGGGGSGAGDPPGPRIGPGPRVS